MVQKKMSASHGSKTSSSATKKASANKSDASMSGRKNISKTSGKKSR